MRLGPLTDLYGTPGAPKRARFGPRKALLVAPEVLGGPQGARFGPNCHRLVKLMITTQFGLVSGPFWPKMPLFGPMEVLDSLNGAPASPIIQ